MALLRNINVSGGASALCKSQSMFTGVKMAMSHNKELCLLPIVILLS